MAKNKIIKKSALSPTVLIAGGAGFVGSHLAESLLTKNTRIIVLDNFSTGKEIHVNHLLTNPNFALYDIDINEGLPEEIESVDYIIHLAGLEEYLYSKEYTDLDSLLTNALGTKNLLDLSKSSPAKFMLISSTDVYQGLMSQSDLKQYFGRSKMDENKYMLTEAKRYAEALVWEYYKKFNLDVRIVRLPEVFGPRMNLDASGYLGKFLKELIEGRNLTVFGEGIEKEFYLYISDAVSGILKALFKDECKGNIYSLVGEDPVSSLEIAYLVKSVGDRVVNIQFKPHPFESDTRPGLKYPDINNIGELGWSHKVSLKEGVIKTLEWFGYSTNVHSFKPAKLIAEKKGPDYISGFTQPEKENLGISGFEKKNTAAREKTSETSAGQIHSEAPVSSTEQTPSMTQIPSAGQLPSEVPVPSVDQQPSLPQVPSLGKLPSAMQAPPPELVSTLTGISGAAGVSQNVIGQTVTSTEVPQKQEFINGAPHWSENIFKNKLDDTNLIKIEEKPGDHRAVSSTVKSEVQQPVISKTAAKKVNLNPRQLIDSIIEKIKKVLFFPVLLISRAGNSTASVLGKIKLPVFLTQNHILKNIFQKASDSRVSGGFSFVKNNSGIILGVFTALIAASVVFITIPAFRTYYSLKKGISNLEEVSSYVGQLDSSRVRENAKEAYENLYDAKKDFRRLGWFLKLIGKKSEYVSVDKLISSMAYFSKAGYDASRSVEPFESLWEVIRPDTPNEINVEQFEQAKLDIGEAKNSLQRAIADYKYVDTNIFPENIKNRLTEYETYLSTAEKSLELAVPLLGAVPEVLGSSGERKYLILFQNSNEIRPTGGFIGSYGVLDFEKGKIKNLLIDDVYNPDGQIDLRNINIEPPEQIKDYLGEEKLHIRNANWNPDFRKSANTIEDLYFKVTGDKLDGVIAVDLIFVENLLRVTGPVFLTSYNEEITAENLDERAEFHSEFDYQDGSDQKRSFLTILGSKLLEKIFALEREKLPTMLTEVYKSLEQKNFLIYFSNSPVNVLLDEKNWNGKLVDMQNDYLYIVNANLGGTKANYYVKNNYNYTVTSQTRDGLLRGIIRAEYKHEGKDNAWPGGPYTNYVRFYTQEGTNLTGAQIKRSGVEESEDIMEKVNVSPDGKYNVFGVGIEVNPGETVFLTVTYDLPQRLSLTKDNKDYSLYWQKQPGSSGDSYTIMFDIPFGMEIQSMSSVFTQELDFVQAKGVFDTDKQFYVKLL